MLSSIKLPQSDQQALTHQLKVSSTWVYVMIAVQLLLSASVWYKSFFLFLVIHSVFIAFGIAGVHRRNRRLIFSHFVYSSALSFVIIFIFCFQLMGGFLIPLFVFAFGIAFLLLQSVGMRHERALLALIALMQEMNKLEDGTVQMKPTFIPVEEQVPFLAYDAQHQLSEEQQIQMFAAMDEQERQQQKQQTPFPAHQYSTLPQYPMMLPFPGQQQPHPYVFVPYNVNPLAEDQASVLYSPGVPPYAYPTPASK